MKTRTITALVAGGIGYVLGAKAGRARYEQIRTNFKKVATDPRVQDVAHKAQEKVEQKAPAVAEKVTAATDKVRHPSGEHAATPGTSGPQGVPDPGTVDRTAPSTTTRPVPGG